MHAIQKEVMACGPPIFVLPAAPVSSAMSFCLDAKGPKRPLALKSIAASGRRIPEDCLSPELSKGSCLKSCLLLFVVREQFMRLLGEPYDFEGEMQPWPM